MTLADMERKALIAAIKSQGSIVGAARHLEIGRATAVRMMKRYGLREMVPAAAPPAEPPVAPKPAPAAAPVVDPLFGSWKP